MTRIVNALLLLAAILMVTAARAEARYDQTPYQQEQKVVFDFFLDEPEKMATALFWIRSYMNPLVEEPYGFAPEFLDIKVIIHGTELVTVARKNYNRYKDIVERMKYYNTLGVEFRVCGLAMEDFGYTIKDLQDFIVVAPSAMTELVHWQQQGYALVRPIVYTRSRSVDEIR